VAGASAHAQGHSNPAIAKDAVTFGSAFAENCFSPYLTAQTAQNAFTPLGLRYEFYDLRPFSSAAPSPVTGRAATPGTDRRCEVAFDGDASDTAVHWLQEGLVRERLTHRVIDVPESFPLISGPKTMAAVQLNPNRIAVVQAGTRPGPNGVETYLNVERLTPLNEAGS